MQIAFHPHDPVLASAGAPKVVAERANSFRIDHVLDTLTPQPKVVGLDAYGLEIVGTRKISEIG